MKNTEGKHAAPRRDYDRETERRNWTGAHSASRDDAWEEPARSSAARSDRGADWKKKLSGLGAGLKSSTGARSGSARKTGGGAKAQSSIWSTMPPWAKPVTYGIVILLLLWLLLVILNGVQRDKFAAGTDINGISVSRMTAENATAEVKKSLNSGRQITLTDEWGTRIGALSVSELQVGDVKSQVEGFLKEQHKKFLPFAFLGAGKGSYTLGWADSSSLQTAIANAIGSYGQSAAQAPKLVYGPNGWEVDANDTSTAPDLATAEAGVRKALVSDGLAGDKLSVAVPLKQVAEVYQGDNPTIQAQIAAIEKATGNSVTLVLAGNKKVTLTKQQLASCFDVKLTDNSADVTLNEESMRRLVDQVIYDNGGDGLIPKYALIGTNDLHLNDWDTGFKLDREALYKAVATALKDSGGEIIAQYDYVSSVKNHFNVGNNSFIEIDIENQFLWFYRRGELILWTPIVSGSVQAGTETPRGAFSVSYKRTDTRLAGDGYEYRVQYWIPFTGKVGIHEGTGLTQFGGDVYKTNGSFGSVLVPESIIKDIYDNCSTYLPVFVY